MPAPEDEGARFAEWLAKLPDEKREALNQKAIESARAEHEAFKAAFDAGQCYMCGKGLDDVTPRRPCLHWMLRPRGVKKSHLEEVLRKHGAGETQNYLRWVANTEAFGVNINDLPNDQGEPKPIEVTIRYKDLEWSLSCAASDLAGHPNSKYGAFPHFHFQMRIGGRPFINYNDFHIPLTRAETAFHRARGYEPRLVSKFPGGEGMGQILTEENLEALVDLSIAAHQDETAAPLSMSTLIMADEGTTMSGDEIYAMIEKARAERRTIASAAKEMQNVSVRTIVTPGPGVVEVAERTKRGGGKEEP
jgi:hypothetical protein